MSLIDDRGWTRGRGPALLQIALGTFSILVLELALIRWMSGQVRILAYFNNLILIGCFLGMGLGLVVGRRRPGLLHLALPLLGLLSVPLAYAAPLRLMHITFPDMAIHLWGAESHGEGVRTLTIILGLFLALVAVFTAAGAAVGHLLAVRDEERASGEPRLAGYSADLLGSLLGVLAVAAVTAIGTTPPVWFALGVLPLLWLSRHPLSFAGAVATIVLAQTSVKGATFSPYNRIDVLENGRHTELLVNRDFHQYMHDSNDPGYQTLKHMYHVPFLLGEKRDRALVAGAGTGNDVQAALLEGYGQVYSVDIDPVIIEIGRAMHPNRPYADPRAVPVVNDARAFFEQYEGPPFDVVAFGFVDSHAMFSALSTLRLDNYLYTEEGLRAAWKLVGPQGHMTVNLSFVAGPWMMQRVYATLEKATGQRPLIIDHRQHYAAMMVVTRDPATLHLERVRFPAFPLRDVPKSVLTTSDDWPYLYLRPGVVPWGYLLVLTAVLAISAALVTAAHGRAAMRQEFDGTLFLMGAGFLLLETRGVTSLSLLFGSTWVVNTVVFSGVLAMALLANMVVQRTQPKSVLVPFALLLASVVLLWVVDVSSLNRLPTMARALAGGALIGLPVGCAGVVVSMLLARAGSLPGALAANLLGSVLGGCLEYLSMYSGLRALALMALGLYLAALLLQVRSTRGSEEGVLAA